MATQEEDDTQFIKEEAKEEDIQDVDMKQEVGVSGAPMLFSFIFLLIRLAASKDFIMKCLL